MCNLFSQNCKRNIKLRFCLSKYSLLVLLQVFKFFNPFFIGFMLSLVLKNDWFKYKFVLKRRNNMVVLDCLAVKIKVMIANLVSSFGFSI